MTCKPEDFVIYAPVSGRITPLEEVPDPVFSQAMLGDGVAIKPDNGLVSVPFDGVVSTLHSNLHALTLSDGNVEILIHIGVETINLGGKGFEALVKSGANVKRGDKLIKFDPSYVATHAVSDLVIVVVISPPQCNLIKTQDKTVKAGESILMVLGDAGADVETAPCGETLSTPPVKVQNAYGLHVRPAGVLANAAAKYKSCVEIEFNGASANAKSIVAIMGLGIERGSVVTLHAAGEDAAEALIDLTTWIERGLGEEITDFSSYGSVPAMRETEIDFSKTAIIKGVSVAPGKVTGKACVLKEEEFVFTAENRGVEEETKILINAVTTAKENIKETILTLSGKKVFTEILTAHIAILEDPFLLETSKNFITQGENAAKAFSRAVEKSIAILSGGANALIKERVADYKDINRKILNILTGTKPVPMDITTGSILITRELLPNDIPNLSTNVVGIICAEGSSASHASIMLRNTGIPAVVGAGVGVLQCPSGIDVILDASAATVAFNPDAEMLSAVKTEHECAQKAREENKKHVFEQAITRDGVRIKIEGSAGSVDEAVLAATSGAEGIGLVRTEFLFKNRTEAPSEQEQYQLYKELAFSAGVPVTFRTFDVGGDKPLRFTNIPHEENPALGLRGVRNYSLNRQLINDQVRAFVRLSAETEILVMIPMVSFTDEFSEIKNMFETARKELGVKQILPLGLTVEIPSAAVMADKFIQIADFFSIGSNDLTQYTLAIDRSNGVFDTVANSLNPAVLKLIGFASKAALSAGKWSGVCGGMAGELYCVPLLIGLGVRELAISPSMTADIKAVIRTLELKKCENVAGRAMELNTAAQVRELIKMEFNL